MYFNRKRNRFRPLLLLLIWSLMVGIVGEPLANPLSATGVSPSVTDQGVRQQQLPIELEAEEYLMTVEEIVSRFETNAEFVREQLETGLSLNEIYYIFYQAEQEDLSFVQAREQLFPEEVNESLTVTSSVYSDVTRTPLLKDVNVRLSSVVNAVYGIEDRETVTENVYVETQSQENTEEVEEEFRWSVTENVYGRESVTENVYETEEDSEETFSSRSSKLLAIEGPPVQEKPPVYQASSFNEAPYSIGNSGESVSSLSGGLSVQSTDLSLPGRAGLSFSLTREYNSSDAQLYEPGYDYREYNYNYDRWWVQFAATARRVVPKYHLYVRENKRLEYDYNSDGTISYTSPPQEEITRVASFDTEEEARRRAEIFAWTLYTVPEDTVYISTSFNYSNVNQIPYSIPIQRNQYFGDIGRLGNYTTSGTAPTTLDKIASSSCYRTISGIYNKGIWTQTGSSPECPSFQSYSDADGYSGTLSRGQTTTGKPCPSPAAPNTNGVCTKEFFAHYSGTVSKVTPDTRVYQQSFGGWITRPTYQSTNRYDAWRQSGTGRVRAVYSRVGTPWVENGIDEVDLGIREVLEFGPYYSQSAAVNDQNIINSSSGSYIDSDIENGQLINYYVATNPGAKAIVESVPATGIEYYNTTSKPLKEKLYPIGKGWSWKLPFVENKNGKTVVHLAEGGSYEVEGTKLKGYEWEGPLFKNDTSITVNGEKSKSVLVSTDGTQLQYFSAEGRLLRISDLFDNTVDFYYETNSLYGTKLLSQIQDAIGNVIQISYNKDQVTMTSGDRTVIYNKSQKDGVELLDSVVDPIGRKTTYNYQIKSAKFNLLSSYPERASSNPYALITRIQHPTGAASEYNYEVSPVKRYIGSDSFNEAYRLSSRHETVSYTTSDTRIYNQQQYSYNNSDMASSYGSNTSFTVTVNDGLTSTMYQYGKKHINDTTAPQYYLESTKQSADKIERSTSYKYDKFVASRSYPARTPTSMRVSNNQNSDVLEIRKSFNDYGNILSEADAKGNLIERTFDNVRHQVLSELIPIQEGKKALTEYTRNAKGNITEMKVTEQPSGKLLGHVRWIAFDRHGNPLEQQVLNDQKTIISLVEYDGQYGHAFPTKQTVQASDGEGKRKDISISSTYNKLTGEMSSSTDAEGHITKYTYDRLGRVIKVDHPDQTSIDAVYDDLNNTLTVTDEVGNRTQTKWNALGWEVENGWFDGTNYVKKKVIGYDSFGRAEWEQDAKGNLTQHRYDSWSRLIHTQYPDGSQSTANFDERLRMTQKVDGEGYTSSEFYDKWGRIQRIEEQSTALAAALTLQTFSYDSVSDFILATTDGKGQTTKYLYNSFGDIIEVINPKDEVTRYAYDMVGNMIETTFADGTVKSKEYNELSLLTRESDEGGQTKTYQYDDNGNVTRYTDRNGTLFHMQYDARNRMTKRQSPDETVQYAYDGTGKRLSMADNTGTTSYQYELNSGRLKQVQYPDGLTFSIPEYDAEGNRKSQIDPFGLNINFSFDSMNRLSKISGSGSTEEFMASYSYTRNGLLKQKKVSANVTTLREYDGIDLTGVSHAAFEHIINRYEYSYDANKNINQRVQNDVNDLYDYDSLNRITRADGSDTESYDYDQRGNRLTMESTRLMSLDEMEYSYDKQNRLTQVRIGSSIINYGYNGDGLLVSRSENGEVRRYYYDGDQMIAEAQVVEGVPQLIASYIRGNQLEAIRYADGTQVYPYYNGHGDVVELRNEDGTILNKYSYDMWGNIIEKEEAVYNPFRYSGEFWDDNTGLQYLRARWYDPSMGRFIGEDTYEGEIDNPLSLNLYTYVINNPLKYVDPSGHKSAMISGVDPVSITRLTLNDVKMFSAWKFDSSATGYYQAQQYFLVWYYGTNANERLGSISGNSYIAVQLSIMGSVGGTDLSKLTVAQVDNIARTYNKISATADVASTAYALKSMGSAQKSIRTAQKACNCFVAGTKVQTDEGEKPIEEIEVGDKVLTKSDETGEVAYKEIVGLFQKQADKIYYIHIGDEIIEVTAEHPLWLNGKGWTEVKDLKVGDLLVSSDGTKLAIDKIEKEPREATVYNFEVADFKSYFVSNLGIWVHNCEILKANNMSEFFKLDFGSSLKNLSQKTSSVVKGATVYKVTGKTGNNYLKKGDQYYLDTLHHDHMEVFDGRGKVKAVLNLDGTFNAKKTEVALKEGRRIP